MNLSHEATVLLRDRVAEELYRQLKPVGLESMARERASNMLTWVPAHEEAEDGPLCDCIEAVLLVMLNFVQGKEHTRAHLRKVAEELEVLIKALLADTGV